eukprot:6313309-Amphidinium_carterae.1
MERVKGEKRPFVMARPSFLLPTCEGLEMTIDVPKMACERHSNETYFDPFSLDNTNGCAHFVP